MLHRISPEDGLIMAILIITNYITWTRRFNAAFRRVSNNLCPELNLQFLILTPIYLRCTLILPSHLRLGLPRYLSIRFTLSYFKRKILTLTGLEPPTSRSLANVYFQRHKLYICIHLLIWVDLPALLPYSAIGNILLFCFFFLLCFLVVGDSSCFNQGLSRFIFFSDIREIFFRQVHCL